MLYGTAMPLLRPLPRLHPIEQNTRVLDRLRCSTNTAFDRVRVVPTQARTLTDDRVSR
jgi:hypothetical protein